MSTGIAILIVFICVMFIVNNTARDFVRRDDYRRQQQYIENVHEQARLNRERAEMDFHTSQMRKAMKDIDKTIISDAEIIDEWTDRKPPKGLI